MSPSADLSAAAAATPRNAVERLSAANSDCAQVGGAEDRPLAEYFRVLYKRRRIALAAFICIVVAGSARTLVEIPIYEARVRLLIEAENPNVVAFKEVIEPDRATADYYQTQHEILQSRRLVKMTLDTLKLWDHVEFAGTGQQSFSVRRAAARLLAALRSVATTGIRGARTTESSSAGETAVRARRIDAVLMRLTVSPVRKSRLVDVKFKSSDPVLAARVANALAAAYIEQNLEFKFSASKQATDWLAQQLAQQRGQVEGSEVALQRYREQNDALSLEERQNIVVQKLADLTAAATRAKTARIQKETQYAQLRLMQKDPAALDTFPAILSNTFIQNLKSELADLYRQESQLSSRLGRQHPEMLKLRSAIEMAEAKLRGEVSKIAESIRNEFRAAEAEERSLLEALEAQKREVLALNRKAIAYGVLQRDATSNQQIFDSLLRRTKETQISGELRSSNIHILDEAEVPRSPVRPRTSRDLLVTVFIGALLSVGLALFLNRLDDRFKSPEDVKEALGLPLLGLVPVVADQLRKAGMPLINNGVPPRFGEAFKTVRTNVLFSAPQDCARALAITSASPNEGKTVVASNLAVALAQAGQRVLLVDADMRRPRVHAFFKQALDPGLSNVIVGETRFNEAARHSAVPRLSILTAGVPAPNPAELLGSPRFVELLHALGAEFDWVLLDSPPVLAVADALIAAHAASGVLFVVGAEMTRRRTAEAALQQLEAVGAKLVGVVVNRLDLDRHAYGCADYYRAYGEYRPESAGGTGARS
jgi:capsular exopolysaccharide synthesis family protein